MTTLIVMAKECLPGRVKTRLSPPYTPEQAATLAAASLADTLRLARSLPARRRILCFQGTVSAQQTRSFEMLPQVQGDLDERIAAALDACSGPVVLIGMDTPQLTLADFGGAFAQLDDGTGSDAYLGPAADGGYWSLGLREPRGDLVRGVPMSVPETGSAQRQRLVEAGLTVTTLPTRIDIDDADSLAAVCPLMPPDSQLMQVLASIDRVDNDGDAEAALPPVTET